MFNWKEVITTKIELRSDSAIISGYVNAVGRESRPISSPTGKFVEQVEPGVFRTALTRSTNVDLLLNHDPNKKLGSTATGELKLEEDNIGLRAEAVVRDAEVIKKARNGELRGWSFGMYVNKAEFEQRAEKLPKRYLQDIDIFEVSIIDKSCLPVYAGTSVECRAENDIMRETRANNDNGKIEIVNVVPPDLSEYEERAYAVAVKPYESRLEELRYNPYHDPTNGRFTSSSNGGNGILHVAKGQKGKGVYVVDGGAFKHSSNAELERSENIKQKFLSKGLSSKIEGIRIKAEQGKGNYAFKNATAVSAKEAEKFIHNSRVHEHDGETLIEGYSSNGNHGYYANKSDSAEIQSLLNMRHKGQDTTIRRHDFSSGVMGTTTTYEKWRKNNTKKITDYWEGSSNKTVESLR
jgi:HK97 family phage prohead protease